MVYKGVVFNEMKGAYSSASAVLGKVSQLSLYPDTTYGVNSGGDPKAIPDLTYDYFKNFHAKYYHPSNSRVVFYGDDDPAQRLEILEEYFGQFERIDPQCRDRAAAALERAAAARRDLCGQRGRGGQEDRHGVGQLDARRDHRSRARAGAQRARIGAGRHARLAAAQGADRFRAGRRAHRLGLCRWHPAALFHLRAQGHRRGGCGQGRGADPLGRWESSPRRASTR